MIIIWGSRWREKDEAVVLSHCTVCQIPRHFQVTSFRRWFTLFFIPILPTSDKKYYLNCPTCENSFVLKKEINVEEFTVPTNNNKNQEYR